MSKFIDVENSSGGGGVRSLDFSHVLNHHHNQDGSRPVNNNNNVDRSDVSISSESSTSYQSLKDDNEKLNKRLSLLRDEYVKLQKKYLNLQTRYDHLVSSVPASPLSFCDNTGGGENGGNNAGSHATPSVNFVQRIVEFVGSLYDNKCYSDLTIRYDHDGRQLPAHKFVLLFRSERWSVPDLNEVDELRFPEMLHDIAEPLFRWVYTGHISERLFEKSEDYVLELVKYAVDFDLKPLVNQCEESLISYVQMHNCIYFYQISEQLGLSRLCDYSAKLVAVNWDALGAADFAKASTPFLHRLFVEKSRYPLHKAIRIRNEDLIFLLLMEFSHQAGQKVNEFDNLGQLPLDLALRSDQFGMAKTLLEYKANVNVVDGGGWPLAHRYLSERLWAAVRFLVEQGASVQSTNPDGDSLLHLCADCRCDDPDRMLDIARMLIERRCDLNLQNKMGDTCLHRCIRAQNRKLFDLLLANRPNVELRNGQHETPLALALDLLADNQNDDQNDSNDGHYFATKLLANNVSVDTVNPVNGDSLLNRCARRGNQRGAIFLVENGANLNSINNRGEAILHLAASRGLQDLVKILLQRNANCNMSTLPPLDCVNSGKKDDSTSSGGDGDGDSEDDVFNQTPLHLAILGRHEAIIKEILSFHDRSSRKGCLDSALLTPDLDVKNSRHQTPLSLSVEMGLTSIAEMLISAGANVNVKNEQGLTLLHRMIIAANVPAAQFLLQHGVDLQERCPLTGESYLQYSIRYRLAPIVESLCKLGANVHEITATGDSLLWEAIKAYRETGDLEIASILVRYQADPNGWHQSPDGGFQQTLLHRALDENNQDGAVFLIHSGCDLHCRRKPGPDGAGREDCDGQTPLHMACSWGMSAVVETLLEYGVDANVTDNEGKTALHMAIINQNHPIIELLLQYPGCDLYKTDNYGQTPFALAIKLKSRQTAQALARRDPTVSEQRDGKGRNYLHLALQRNDYDAVLFLLDNKIDVNARVSDSSAKAPIHLAAETGSEIILRTLVLAGSELNVLTAQNQTALHLAAELDKYQIVEILFDLGIDPGVQDMNGQTAFHLAALRGHHNTSRVLIDRGCGQQLSEQQQQQQPALAAMVDPRQTNFRGQNVVHCLAVSANKSAAAAIFEELIVRFPDLDLDARDNEGNTALLLAYMNGNGKLCRSIVKCGARLGIRNNQGVSIFNHTMPTRQLLTSLLDSLVRMPGWRDGPECLECGQKFNITNRRHHCRHCGRELCSRCSSKEILIMKFQQDKKSIQSRVCELCYDVLTLGVFN